MEKRNRKNNRLARMSGGFLFYGEGGDPMRQLDDAGMDAGNGRPCQIKI